MDIEQEEMQFLGVFDIFKEAYKIILTWRKIFSQITLTLIFPLSLLILIHIEVSDILFRKIIHNEIDLDETQVGTPKYNKLSDLISSEWTYLWLFKAAYFTFLLIFSLLSTSAVVYTVASVFTARELSFKKVMSVVPKVWKRLMVTFLWTFLAFFAYNVVAMILLIVVFVIMGAVSYYLGIGTLVVLGVSYVGGFIYLGLVWQLASVVSVLEDARGIQAMNKSKALMKGKMWTAIFIFGILTVLSFVIQFAFQKLVVHGWSFGELDRICYGILSLLVFVKLMLFGLVIQTILYFVCKSFHHENIDKSALSDHLEVYLLGEYVPLKAKDVQLEHFEV
ncbi:polyadenylate-binding protein 1-B-binding protein [Parasponia andersonii]|uniref:Polyadenylate-binding protein 1-B-binding protein n=1 Tax=Parasponia andersonii TaxID=3476 RepID=A0A2P5CIG7_PARAD|nr:polyadenylate-binding protein 1-B-binding protein [Parasponia andersonii]